VEKRESPAKLYIINSEDYHQGYPIDLVSMLMVGMKVFGLLRDGDGGGG